MYVEEARSGLCGCAQIAMARTWVVTPELVKEVASARSMAARPYASATWVFFFSSRRRHTRCSRDWSSDVCSSDLEKHYLVPVVERVPFVPARLMQSVPGVGRWSGGFGRGRSLPVYWNTLGRFGVMICYESAFEDLARGYRRRGAEFLVNITNDAWYGRTAGPYQHAAQDRKSTRLNSSHGYISYAVFCLKKKKNRQ